MKFKTGVFSIHTFWVLLLFFFGACSYFGKKGSDQKIVAKVFDKTLDYDDLKLALPKDITGKDSVDFVKNYINQWIRQEILINKAEQNLSDDNKSFDKEIEDYKNSLVIYAFEKALVEQKLDTTVSVQEIEKYYKENPSNFELKDNIIKVNYIKIQKKAPKVDKAKTLFKSSNEKDQQQLKDYCIQYADNFYFDDDSWLLFDDLLKEIPIKTYNQEQFLENNRFVELQDAEFLYLVNIKGFKIKDGVSPLSFETENIKNIIINKRKIKLIEQMKQNLYNEALKNKDFEIIK
jgi:hypothetical protein